jgi:hypothetical protein
MDHFLVIASFAMTVSNPSQDEERKTRPKRRPGFIKAL